MGKSVVDIYTTLLFLQFSHHLVASLSLYIHICLCELLYYLPSLSWQDANKRETEIDSANEEENKNIERDTGREGVALDLIYLYGARPEGKYTYSGGQARRAYRPSSLLSGPSTCIYIYLLYS